MNSLNNKYDEQTKYAHPIAFIACFAAVTARNCPGTSIAAIGGKCCLNQTSTNIAPQFDGAEWTCTVGGPVIDINAATTASSASASATATATATATASVGSCSSAAECPWGNTCQLLLGNTVHQGVCVPNTLATPQQVLSCWLEVSASPRKWRRHLQDSQVLDESGPIRLQAKRSPRFRLSRRLLTEAQCNAYYAPKPKC